MAVFDNLNYTHSAGVEPGLIQDYYERTVLKNAKKKLPHCRDLEKVTLPPHNGRRVTFHGYTPFAPVTDPLKEGVTPAGQALTMFEISATVKPYARHVEYTDEMNWAMLDNVQKKTAELLSDQALESIDTVAAAALSSGTNVIYVDADNGTNSSRSDITAADILTYQAIKRAVRALKKNGAEPFADGCYHAIVDADTVYDLTSDAMWVDVAKYQDKEKVEMGELGKIYGVKFYEASTAHTFPAQSYLYDSVESVAISAGSAAGKTVSVAASTIDSTSSTQRASVAHYIRRMSGKMVTIYDASATAGFPAVIDKIDFDGTNVVHTLRYIGSNDWTYTSGDLIKPAGAGASNYTVHSTIVYGKGYAGCVELDGNGKNVQIIYNPPGSAGAADPLAQRGTIAWKVKGFCATVLQEAFGVRLEHGVSA